MPLMSGLEAAPVLSKMLPQVALILFTHHDGHPVEILAKRLDRRGRSMAASRLIAQAQALLTGNCQEGGRGTL
jgi:hypothetical protein